MLDQLRRAGSVAELDAVIGQHKSAAISQKIRAKWNKAYAERSLKLKRKVRP